MKAPLTCPCDHFPVKVTLTYGSFEIVSIDGSPMASTTLINNWPMWDFPSMIGPATGAP